MKNILITGGAGYIGTAIATRLTEAGYSVTVFDDCSTGQPALLPKSVSLVCGDVTDLNALVTLVRSHQFDAVIHCAAKKAVGESEIDPALYFHTNVAGSLNVLRAMELGNIPHLVFSSTAAVYDPRAAHSLLTEDAPIAPSNVYGRTKRMVEEMIETYARLGKISSYTIFRYFNVAGDAGLYYREEMAQNIFPLIARVARDGKTFSIFGKDYETRDGTGVRDYIHLSDLIDAHERALTASASGIFNLGTSTGYSVEELVTAFNALLPVPVPVEIAPRRPGDPASLVADATKARDILGWEPRYTIEDMIKSTIATYLRDSSVR